MPTNQASKRNDTHTCVHIVAVATATAAGTGADEDKQGQTSRDERR